MKRRGLRLPVWALASGLIAFVFVLSLLMRLLPGGTLHALFCALALFLSINLLVCYAEACLLWRRREVVRRASCWAERQAAGGPTAAVQFLTRRVPLREALSTALWTDMWAAYAVYDDSYLDRGSYGFIAETANAPITVLASLLLLATYAYPLLPAVAAGIVGVALFWQWLYATSLYVWSFFLAGRHRRIGRMELYCCFFAPNGLWLLFPILGMYVSVRLIVDGSYTVLGY